MIVSKGTNQNDKWDDLSEDVQRYLLKSDMTEEEIATLAKKHSTTVTGIKEKKDYYETVPVYKPNPQDQIGEHGGTDAQLFTKEAKSMSYAAAFCELIDGILENHSRQNDKKKKTEIKFKLMDGGKRLILDENSGGIPRKSFDSIATIGSSDWGSLYGVGVFGVGLKKALRKISKIQTLFTWCKTAGDSQPAQIRFDQKFWNEAGSAKVKSEVTSGNSLMTDKEGHTIIVFEDLEKYTNEKLEFTEDFIHKIGTYYHQWLSVIPGEVKVSFHEGPGNVAYLPEVDLFSDEKIKSTFSYFPFFEPRSFVLKTTGEAKDDGSPGTDVEITVKFGLTRDVSDGTDFAGVYVYGNDRLFKSAGQGMEFGFGTTGKFGKVGGLNSETFRFRAKVDVRAKDPYDIPWNVGEKNGYNEAHPTASIITEMVSLAAIKYLDFANITKNHHTIPFTVNGIDMKSNDDWLDCFFPENKDSSLSKKLKQLKSLLGHVQARTSLLTNPIDFSRINDHTTVEGTWNPSHMGLVRDALWKKIQSQNTTSYPDEEWVEDFLKFNNITIPKTGVKPKGKTTAKGKQSKKGAKRKPSEKKELQALPQGGIDAAKKAKKKKIEGKSQKLQAYITPDSVKIFLDEAPFKKIDAQLVRSLLVHFMLTSSQYNLKEHPKDYSQASLEKWLKQKKWQKKKNP